MHLHLELRRGGTTANPFGTRESWDGKTIDGWTVWMFRWPGDLSNGISYRGSVVKGASRTQSITNVTCGQTTADAIVSASYPNQTIASNDLDSNTGFANFTNAPSCQAVDCKSLASSNNRNTNTGNSVDVFFIVDLSSSFKDDLPIFKTQAPEIISSLKASSPDIRFGLGSFEDYPISPFGGDAAGDVAYRRNIDLTLDSDAVEAVISGLSTRFGGDLPQSQLPALFQAATGDGQTIAGFPKANIPAGQQANFRDGAIKIIVLWTDASFHKPGDPGDIPYPGPSFAETVDAILALDPPMVIGISSGGDGIADLKMIAKATGALAPPGGVDCNDDGTIDILKGEPLVCTIASSGVGIGRAITALVEAAIEAVNNPPIANAGPNQSVNERATVTLDGSKSSDLDGNPLTFAWKQTVGPSVTLSSPTVAQPTFTAPEVTADTVLTFQLIVNDGTVNSAPALVTVTVRNVNRPPTANAGPNQTVNEGTVVTLNGTGSSDPDGNSLTFVWKQTVGPSVTLSSTTVAQPTFVTPQVTAADTTLTFQLVVNDGQVNSAPATVNITVRDVVIVTPPPASGGGGGGGGCAMNPKAGFDPMLIGIVGFSLVCLAWRRIRRSQK